jgi:hypothetical protein
MEAPMRRMVAVFTLVIPLALSCTLSPQATQTPWIVTATSQPATQTPWVITATTDAGAPPTEAPIATTAVAIATNTNTPLPTTAPTSTPTIHLSPTAQLADLFAPNQLPPGYTGVIFKVGDCFDMDLWGMVHDNRCDFRLDANLIVTPVNGGLISGHGRQAAPSLHTCQADQLLANPVAPNTNIFLCARTNLGAYGFFVQRTDTPFAEGPRMIFDYWLFK